MVDLKIDEIKKKVARKVRRDFDRMWNEFWEKYMRFYGYNGRKSDSKTSLSIRQS